MFVLNKVNTTLFRSTVTLNEYLLFNHVKFYNKKGNTEEKRGAMLMEMIANKDKRKHWHFNILSDKPKARLFDKVHKPHRRQTVLNALFIKNITDVISTGDVAPEIANYGIEITGVRVSPCCKLLNVFWQVPSNHYDSCEDIGKVLTTAAPKIRAELISRNVLGRVPYIFFLRDVTNERIALFEHAIEKLHVETPDLNIVADDSFLEDIYSFKKAKVEKKEDIQDIPEDTKEEVSHSDIDDTKEEVSHSDIDDTKKNYPALPQKPVDMKCDIFGLDHERMMEKVIALKKKKKDAPLKTALISPESLNSDDLFDKIPGTRFEVSSSRDDILKRFQIERKMLMQKKKKNINVVHNPSHGNHNIEDTNDIELNSYEEDFIDDETTENSH